MVIDPAGIILTNNHVIEGASEVKVVFNDDREPMTGEVVGAVPERDLAVVKVDADDLTAIELGTSDDLELGTSVIAIGFPLGLGGPTVTQGIISGLERTITVEGSDPGQTVTFEGLLQTDAAINPGNSGGALIDSSGRLVGVNSAAASPGSAENIGFAIAIDAVVPAVEAILGPEQAWLGVSLAPIEDASTAAQAGFDAGARGALIVELLPGGPADDADVPVNTLIVEVAGKKVDEFDDVTEILSELSPGDKIQISVQSPGGGTQEVELKLEARPKDQLRAPG